jgi:adenylate cyclase
MGAEVHVEQLLPPDVKAIDALAMPRHAHGEELEIAVLFADLRGFTRLSENRLPYDVVFLLNRYFASMGMAITGAGGRLDKFIGDGVMALFGVDDGAEAGCRNAIRAARRMSEELNTLNGLLTHDLKEPLKIGIGIHFGHAIVGQMGYGAATQITAIGDTVNTASRLESMTKEAGAQLILSDDVGARAGVDLSKFELMQVSVRGRAGTVNVRRVVSALELPPV